MKEKNVMKQTPPSNRAVESLGYPFSPPPPFPFSLGLRISFHHTTYFAGYYALCDRAMCDGNRRVRCQQQLRVVFDVTTASAILV